MKILFVIAAILLAVFCLAFNFQQKKEYTTLYNSAVIAFKNEQLDLQKLIRSADLSRQEEIKNLKSRIASCRLKLKSIDFWLRYFEPVAYRKINGPLPVEWENEVFEKFEPPYRREGAGLTLLEQALDEESIDQPHIDSLLAISLEAVNTFEADSITGQLSSYHHFFLANRLYLLNLGAIYTTGFDCPNPENIIPELVSMTRDVKNIYSNYSNSFPSQPISSEYIDRYNKLVTFVNSQPSDFTVFDHFRFIRDHVNPLFRLNQDMIRKYSVVTTNYNDYALNNESNSIFDKALYLPQNTKGIYSLIEDESLLREIKQTGKLLFYDPILSANNARSCASCHKPTQYFTDTTVATALHFDRQGRLQRNTPSLINAVLNHLVMLDGKHISLQDQAQDVMHNTSEMNSAPEGLVKKIMDCKEYKNAFKKFLKHTPEEKEVTLSHIVSAITFYYADFSNYYSPFDDAMNNKATVDADVQKGFNLFMSKAQCGTCHFVPVFNGIKPPYISSEFEVIGVPADTGFHKLSDDRGRYLVNPAKETMNAFRTNTIRNISHTRPYMHNGVFETLEQVIDMYDAGGGAGRKLKVDNQTLATDSLKLTSAEKKQLIAFMKSLNENIVFDLPPASLPKSSKENVNNRKPGGEY